MIMRKTLIPALMFLLIGVISIDSFAKRNPEFEVKYLKASSNEEIKVKQWLEQSAEIELITTQSSIHAIIIGDEKKALLVSDTLKKQGIWLTAIRPPTVAVNSSRLRVTICANHNIKDIKYLAESINKAIA